MSQSQQINRPDHSTDVAPTPQNTPLDTTVLANRPANLGKPQVEDIGENEEEEGEEDVTGLNPASLLAKVSATGSGETCAIGARVRDVLWAVSILCSSRAREVAMRVTMWSNLLALSISLALQSQKTHALASSSLIPHPLPPCIPILRNWCSYVAEPRPTRSRSTQIRPAHRPVVRLH